MYKVYENENSLKRANSRILQGGESEVRGNKISWWNRKIFTGVDLNETVYEITNVTAGRPDLVAYEFYSTTELEWIILQYNNIIDVKEEFTLGKKIKVPSKSYVNTAIITKPSTIV